VVPGLRKTGASRSFTDLRKAANESLQVPRLHRTRSTDALVPLSAHSSTGHMSKVSDEGRSMRRQETDDAALMKTRSSQKTFVWVKVSRFVLVDIYIFVILD
jgi:hypothetical protein